MKEGKKKNFKHKQQQRKKIEEQSLETKKKQKKITYEYTTHCTSYVHCTLNLFNLNIKWIKNKNKEINEGMCADVEVFILELFAKHETKKISYKSQNAVQNAYLQ